MNVKSKDTHTEREREYIVCVYRADIAAVRTISISLYRIAYTFCYRDRDRDQNGIHTVRAS